MLKELAEKPFFFLGFGCFIDFKAFIQRFLLCAMKNSAVVLDL
jgi:hypothetical protein